MKIYLYVSDTKLEMLYAQIPKNIRDQIIAELKIDLKIVAVSLKKAPNEDTRYSKLQVVCDYLDREGVGSIDSPAPFFRGTLPMRWGLYSYSWGAQATNAVFFAGSTGTAIVGLGGSARHLIVNTDAGEIGSGWASSGTPMLMELLASSSERLKDDTPLDGEWWAADVAWFSEHGSAPQEPVEFLARRLKQAALDTTPVLLGTPLYIASADS